MKGDGAMLGAVRYISLGRPSRRRTKVDPRGGRRKGIFDQEFSFSALLRAPRIGVEKGGRKRERKKNGKILWILDAP